MTKQEYLRQYLKKWQEIDSLKSEIEQLRSRAEQVTQVITDMPRSGNSIGFPGVVERIMELQQRIEVLVLEAINIRTAIEDKLSLMENGREQNLLRYRYINGFTYETISERMELSDRWVRSLHAKALTHFEFE